MSTLAAGFWAVHGEHVVFLAGPMIAIAVFATVADLRARRGQAQTARTRGQRGRLLAPAAATLSAAAGIVHGVVCPEHFHEATIYGVFFLVAAAAQLSWAVLITVRPSAFLWAGAFAGNAAIVALWAYTRAVGVPLGPGAGSKEAIGALDIIATTLEIGLVVVCALALRRLAARSTAASAGARSATSSSATTYPEDGSARPAAGATLLK